MEKKDKVNAALTPGDAVFNSYFSHLGDDGRGETVSATGTWDVKHVLGEVAVAPAGSCAFECPANNAVYFQLLDSLGRCVQTMRSWTMVAPGEEFACVGCHEDKMQVYPADKGIASSKAYRSLTSGGAQTARLNWYSDAGRSEMLPPYAQGSATSKIMQNLEPSHHGVLASDAEKRLFACWIDLAIPFAGSYAEQTVWTAEDRKMFEYHQSKRAVFACEEIENIKALMGENGSKRF